MTKRDELIEEIEGELPSLPVDGEWVTQASFEQIADFILAREAKMLDGLRTARLNYAHDKVLFPLLVAIDKTFRDAGVEL